MPPKRSAGGGRSTVSNNPLSPSFDPSSVNINKLRGILFEHDVVLPANSKKAELVRAYEEQVRPRSAEITASKANVQPSSNGIELVGQPSPPSVKPPLKRKVTKTREVTSTVQTPTTRRKTPKIESSIEAEVTPNPPSQSTTVKPTKSQAKTSKAKRTMRESSILSTASNDDARPHKRSRKSAKLEQPIAKEDEDVEMEMESLEKVPEQEERLNQPKPSPSPPRKTPSKTKAVSPVNKKYRDSEVPLRPEFTPEPSPFKRESVSSLDLKRERDSRRRSSAGFSDFNPFQSGDEDSPKPRRQSGLHEARTSHALSIEPRRPLRISSPLVPLKKFSSPNNSLDFDQEVIETFDNEQHPKTYDETSSHKKTSRKSSVDKNPNSSKFEVVISPKEDILKFSNTKARPKRKSQESVTSRGTQKESSPQSLNKSVKKAPLPAPKTQKRIHISSTTILISCEIFIAVLVVSYAVWYINGVYQLGYCDSGKSSNYLQDLRGDIRLPFVTEVPDNVRSVLEAARPSCTKCPAHAVCVGSKMRCHPDYVIQKGLFGNRCVPDTEKMIRIAQLSNSIKRELQLQRGKIICNGVAKKSENTEDWRKFGVREDSVRRPLETRLKGKISDQLWHESFDLAVQDLLSSSDITMGISPEDGETWLAAKEAVYPILCSLKLRMLEKVYAHKASLFLLCFIIGSFYYGRYRLKQGFEEKELVKELVSLVFSRLRQQELRHHADPVVYPYPFISPTHLRDDMLSEYSASSRRRLWAKVERAIQGNSNVRVRTGEQRGEEMLVWEWVGAVGYSEWEDSPRSSPRASVGSLRKSLGGENTRFSLGGNGSSRNAPWVDDSEEESSERPRFTTSNSSLYPTLNR